ncbi:hypothetical protein QFZ27_004661 [Inquilinus ginsengisoli]|uniref:hypothetical protein n=1 Tax=Inquilinus ginsengisoli TaxID=363840 RepID=UPI003D25D5DA
MADHKTERAFAAAIRKAVNRAVSAKDKRRRLEAIADKLVEQAMEGESSAIQEIGNRLDGKARQQIELQVENRMTIVIGSNINGVETDGPFCLVNGAEAAAMRGVEQHGETEEAPAVLPPPEPYAG